MPRMPIIVGVVLISELVAFMLIRRLWRSDDNLVLKILLTVVALVPVLGPLLALWIVSFPDEAPASIQNQGPRGNYYREWSRVIGERNPIRRFRLWRAQVATDEESDP